MNKIDMYWLAIPYPLKTVLLIHNDPINKPTIKMYLKQKHPSLTAIDNRDLQSIKTSMRKKSIKKHNDNRDITEAPIHPNLYH